MSNIEILIGSIIGIIGWNLIPTIRWVRFHRYDRKPFVEFGRGYSLEDAKKFKSENREYTVIFENREVS